MYKRKARVLFVSRHCRARPVLAAALAGGVGADWLEGRAAGIDPKPVPLEIGQLLAEKDESSPGRCLALAPELLEWADLVVAFTEDDLKTIGPLPATTRSKVWDVEPDETNPDRLYARLKHRVECMVGGMRMLSRVDEDD
ncbi:MAG: hypothetical protein P8Y64_05955 [Gammaproteobacteria bacterium]|jgi:protein-tyrosine-phosphatase